MPTISDDRILEQLHLGARTAGALGVSAARLKTIQGVEVVGSVRTGRRGRPALLFALAGKAD